MNRQLYTILVAIVLIVGMNSSLHGQVDGGLGGDLGGGQVDAGALENQIFDAVGDNSNSTGSSGGLTSDGDSAGFQFDDLFNFGNFGDAGQSVANERDAPFVGITLGEVPENYPGFRHVGPILDTFGTADVGSGFGNRGSGASGRGTQGGQGTQNGFEVPRQGNAVRSRIVPRFNSRPLAPAFVTNQINQRFSPNSLQRAGMNANISVQGRTAVISGTARNQQQARVLSRQLRFEPGISRVRNQLRVAR